MPGPTLTPAELGEELGRSEAWLREKWRELVAAKLLPSPLMEGHGPLRWSRAQVYAYLDKPLPPPQRLAAQAYRAAAAAAAGETPHTSTTAIEDATWRDRLDRRFTRENQ